MNELRWSIRVAPAREAPVNVRVVGLCCPFCKDSLEGAGSFVECAACATWFHEECFFENRGCMTFGCSEQRSKAPVVRARSARGSRVTSSTTRYVHVTVEVAPSIGNSVVDNRLRAIFAFAVMTLAMIPTALYSRHGVPVLPVGLGAAIAYVGLASWIGRRRVSSRELSGWSQFVCIVSGLFYGTVGLPLTIYGIAALLDSPRY